MGTYYDRYKEFRNNGQVKPIPGIVIPQSSTDKVINYKLGKTRLDKVSNDYYNNPFHGWLILLANPQFGGLEYKIPDGEVMRIPYPFESALQRYSKAVAVHKSLYGE